jgi:hypothetical protein
MKIRWGILLTVLLAAAPMWAALGDSVQSIQAEQKRWGGQLTSRMAEGYTVHEIRSAGNAAVRQYVSPGGTVFGVAWEGPTMPDLSQLLGSYFPQLQAALASGSRRRGPLFVQVGSFVVESGGHMRAYHGRAYVTDLMPSNVSKDVVQ